MVAVRGINRSQAKIQADKIRKALVAPQPLRMSALTEPGDQIRIGANGAGGKLGADGTLDWAGTAVFRDPGTLTAGDSTFADVKVTETLDVTATTRLRDVVTLESDLKVQAPGKVDLGGIVLEPSSVGGGAINFAPTGSIFAGLGTLGIVAPDLTATLTVGNGRASVAGDIRGSEGLQIMDLPAAPSGTTVYQVVVGADATFYRGAVI